MANNIDFLCTSSSKEEQNKMNTIEDSLILLCEGIARWNWIGKCVVLQNASGVAVASRICCNVGSNVVIGSLESFGDTHVAVRYRLALQR